MRPADMSFDAVCDGTTALWQEVVVIETAENGGCAGEPPAEYSLAVCNTETGLWEDDHIAMHMDTYLEATIGEEEEPEI